MLEELRTASRPLKRSGERYTKIFYVLLLVKRRALKNLSITNLRHGASDPCCRSLPRASDVFDENYLVAALVVDQIIGYLLYKHDAETSRTHPHFRSQVQVPHRVFGRIVHRCMIDGAQFEAGTGVSHLNENHARRADIGELTTALWLNAAPVFNGVREQLMNGQAEFFTQLLRQVGHLRAKELDHLFLRLELWCDPETNPSGQRRCNLYVRNPLKSLFSIHHVRAVGHRKVYLLI